ncbi:TetR/AcrR family transcriptional regulator [Acidiferrimicrobium sp. IK]|uniref:TetR/AcrR family transcriptional regulator n=1 Tax=Acidiferrimicrobium sp. IK TaxID=2871700 RepID=UPI0021CB660E|nr:TetR/AcrR family transcriptional regulator [Acidiferrimicrobium sp. IK]MCU4183882.1 TetR/AcrR family transcriptional regulator [Acidiferrimicrobium sp. IK]
MNKIEDILSATADTLAERGYHETNLESIAERLDLTKATLYHYFSSKDDLVTASLAWVGIQVNEQMAQVNLDPEAPAADQLRFLIRTQLKVVVRERRQAARLFLYPLDWPEPHRGHVKQLRQEHDQIFRSVIERGLATGQFAVDDEATALHCLHGAMNYVPVWFRAKRAKDYERMYETMSGSLLRLFTPAQ